MHWIAPSEKDTASSALEWRLWDAAYPAQGILYLSPEARFDTLLALPEASVAGAIMQSP